MKETNIFVELDGTEFEVYFEYSYSYTPANTNGRPEDCHPESEEWEWELVGVDEMRYNAIELWELYHLDESVFFDAAIEDMSGSDYDLAN